jgi:putative flippase GtrA
MTISAGRDMRQMLGIAALHKAPITVQFIKFLIFGGLAAAVNLGVGLIAYAKGPDSLMPYWLAVLVAASCGLLVNFILNHLWNFRYRLRSTAAQLKTFTVVATIGTLLTVLLAEGGLRLAHGLGVERLALPFASSVSARFASHFCAVGLVTFYSFFAHRYFSFNVGFRARLRQFVSSRG